MEECFAVAILELGLSPEEFYELTPYEFSVLVFYSNDKKRTDMTLIRNAVYNAGANLMRKKGEKSIPLFDDEAYTEEELKEATAKEREDFLKEKEQVFKTLNQS